MLLDLTPRVGVGSPENVTEDEPDDEVFGGGGGMPIPRTTSLGAFALPVVEEAAFLEWGAVVVAGDRSTRGDSIEGVVDSIATVTPASSDISVPAVNVFASDLETLSPLTSLVAVDVPSALAATV